MPANTFHYSRSTVIAATPSDILPEISDLKRHELWSPFAAPDPKTIGVYEGPAGAGQSYSFSGGKSGSGYIVVDAVQRERVVMTLSMLKPMRAVNTVEFALTPSAEGTRVEWAMHGSMGLVGRIFGMFVDCDRMCGAQFEQGLAALKALVEARPSERVAA